ncbi:MAG: GAF domain-containing sensor histidine kinase [Ardenticatenaceae bacterium]|nr:GAF domain-containing sensor histidine kinase [Anaerolineales bacterium]MCB8922910.1 GAF domain-containing sensor histidine kinase [Ardenticatenaceae bacterium]MCB8990354.1 GAF domain-containing sensor histidine kinase [Ardenticatenaceae bacterium]MCB9005247.1 GAF domain-containing sensor histidine kinase [Ardenticatenaceae bacterium]
MNHIITQAALLTHAEAASILLLDANTRQLRFKAASNDMNPAMKDIPVPLDGSIAGAVLQANKAMIIADVSRDSRWNQNVSDAIEFQTTSILGVPMHDVDRPVGVLEALNKQDGSFTDEDVETLSILADIAGVAVEKARLIEQLQQAYDELNELDQRKTDFIAIASHELRTPLSIILGYVSFLREEADPMMAEQLDSVMGAAIQLRSLIQDMLNLQYVETGDTAISLQLVDLVGFVRALSAKDETAVARQLTIMTHLPTQIVPVQVDPDIMEIVFNNLFDNAIKFSPEGGRIDLTVERRGDEAWLRLQDQGPGIPADKLERVFKRFYQVEHHMRRQYEGLGLGLSIAKELVELHHGRIWAESAPGQGSQFYIALPIAK